MNNKKHTMIISVAAVLAALIATAAVMTGCGKSDESSDAKETRVVNETQIVTKIVDGVITNEKGEPVTDSNGQPVTAVQVGTDANGDPVYSADGGSNGSNAGSNQASGNSGNSQSGNSGSQSSGSAQSSGSGSQSSQSGQSGQSSQSGGGQSSGGSQDSKTLTLDGKSYNVGDKVTCTYKLTSKKLLSNFQAEVRYDNKCLKPTNAYLDGPAKSGSVINYELYDKGKIKFNGIKLNGYNYTKGDNFLVVEYEVTGGGSTAPEFVWVIATDTNDNALVNNGTPDSSLSLSATYS